MPIKNHCKEHGINNCKECSSRLSAMGQLSSLNRFNYNSQTPLVGSNEKIEFDINGDDSHGAHDKDSKRYTIPVSSRYELRVGDIVITGQLTAGDWIVGIDGAKKLPVEK
jgi:hypothetical protein